jgi:hypothetical protein
MGRRRRKGGADALLVIAAGVGLIALPNDLTRVCFVVLLIFFWVAVFMPTTCDVAKKSGIGSCGNNCRGYLRACWIRDHKRQKRRAILSWFGIRIGPTKVWHREMPAQSAAYPMGSPWEVTVVPRLGRDAYDKAILALTAAGVVGTFLGLVVAR